MYKEIINVFSVTVILFLTYMCFFEPDYQIIFIPVLIFFLVLFCIDYYKDNILKIKIDDNYLEIINKHKYRKVPIKDIQYCKSIICANYLSSKLNEDGLSFSHKLLVQTKSKRFWVKYPERVYSTYRSHLSFALYDEVFMLGNLPNYQCDFNGNVNYIKNDIEYYLQHNKRQNLIIRCYLYFGDLPLYKKNIYVICMVLLLLFILCTILLITYPLFTFIQDHGVFFSI